MEKIKHTGADDGDCQCEFCKDPQGTIKKEKEMIEKCGWISHYVFDDSKYPFRTNAHTHGLDKKYKYNFQICLRIDPKLVNSLFWSIVRQLEDGVVFVPGKKYGKIIASFDVMFAYAYSTENEVVLRLILPDEKGDFHSALYGQQWQGTYSKLKDDGTLTNKFGMNEFNPK